MASQLCTKLCASSLPAKAEHLCALVEKMDGPVCKMAPGLCADIQQACSVADHMKDSASCTSMCTAAMSNVCNSELPHIVAKDSKLASCTSPACVSALCDVLVGSKS